MPYFDNNSFVEFPRSRWKGGGFEKVYFAKKGANKCVNFESETVYGPNPEDMKRAISSSLLGELGKEKPRSNVIQAAYLLHATMSNVGSVGAKFRVFCKE